MNAWKTQKQPRKQILIRLSEVYERCFEGFDAGSVGDFGFEGTAAAAATGLEMGDILKTYKAGEPESVRSALFQLQHPYPAAAAQPI